MHLQCRSIPCASIRNSTTWSLHPWTRDCPQAALHTSLKALGIVHPPLVMEEVNSTFTVISGQRRVDFAAVYLKQDHVDCKVVSSDIDPHLLFDIILEDLPRADALSLAEKAVFLSLAAKYFDNKSLVPLFFNTLGIQRKQSFLHDLSALLEQDEKFIVQVHGGLIEEQMLSELLRLREEDRTALTGLFSVLQLGTGKQKKTLNLLRDAAYKEQLSVSEYLDKEEIVAIIKSATLNIPQKIQHLDHYLQQRIYSASIEAENTFLADVKALKLQKNQKITHTPAFEKDRVTLSIEFDSLQLCRSFLEKIQDTGREDQTR